MMNLTLIAPKEEYQYRWEKCRSFLKKFAPHSEGVFLFSRLNIYYFSGSFVSGILWLPVQGDPILLCRRGFERAQIESPLKDIFSFTSYRDIARIFNDLGKPLPDTPGMR